MTKLFLSGMILLYLGAFAIVLAKPTQHGQRKWAAAAACTASQLSVRTDPNFEGDAAMGGQRGEQFLVRNRSNRTCTVRGTPGVTLVDRRGHRMGHAVSPIAGGSVTLRAGHSATLDIGYHSCQAVAQMSDRNPKRCKLSKTVQIRFRGISRVFSVPDKLDPEDGVENVIEWKKQ